MHLSACCLLTQCYHPLYALQRETHHIIPLHIRTYQYVGVGAVLIGLLPVGTRYQPVEYAAYAEHLAKREIARVMVLIVHVDGYHYVGAHGTNHIHRQVVEHATVYQSPRTPPHGLVHPWDGHASTHGTRQHTVVEHYLRGSVDVDCHGTERDGQTVKLHLVRTMGHAVKQSRHFVTVEHAHKGRTLVLLLLLLARHRETEDIHHTILLAQWVVPELLLTVGQQRQPLLGTKQGVQLLAAVPHGIQTAKYRTNASASYVVGHYAALLQHLQGTYLGGTLSSAAA